MEKKMPNFAVIVTYVGKLQNESAFLKNRKIMPLPKPHNTYFICTCNSKAMKYWQIYKCSDWYSYEITPYDHPILYTIDKHFTWYS